MATKQNGVLATFTPTVSKYTNRTLPDNGNTVAATGYNIYTCPGATLMSGKLYISNNIARNWTWLRSRTRGRL